MNRLIVLNRFFYPDHSATSQILTDLRLHFAASGVDVHVIITSLAAIAGQSDHSANAYIPRNRERPASPHPSDYVDEDFGIAPGRKIAPESFQLGAQLRMVVNFAVKSNNPAVAHFPHGLVAQTPRFNAR
jgi:hypothetical protein